MKQYTTIRQVNELNKKEKNKIEKFGTKIGDVVIMSIGETIAFLGDDIRQISTNTGMTWTVIMFGCKTFTKEELIDALWKAVKYKLKDI